MNDFRRALIVKRANSFVALPLEVCREIIQVEKVTPIPLTDDPIYGIIQSRGVALPLLDVGQALFNEHADVVLPVFATVIEIQKKRFGVLFEQVLQIITVKDDDVMKYTPTDNSDKFNIITQVVQWGNEMPYAYILNGDNLIKIYEASRTWAA